MVLVTLCEQAVSDMEYHKAEAQHICMANRGKQNIFDLLQPFRVLQI